MSITALEFILFHNCYLMNIKDVNRPSLSLKEDEIFALLEATAMFNEY